MTTEPRIMMPLYVRPAKKKAVDALAKRLDVSTQSLLREGIDLVLAKYARRRP
jgi:hypothetical protein